MKRLIALLGLCLLVPSLAAAQAVINRQNYTWMWENVVWDDADTLACIGEPLVFNGPIHVVLMERTDSAGRWHFKYLYHPQNVEVVGQTSGDHYMALGATEGTVTVGGGTSPFMISMDINTSPIVKPGSGFLLNSRWVLHVTITPDGKTTADLEFVEAKCHAPE